jgi:hypothetical protein
MNKRKYVGYRIVKNTLLDYCEDGVRTTHTAREIGQAHDLNPASVRIAAKYLNIILKPDKRGGVRYPSNGHIAKKLLTANDQAQNSPIQ